MLIFVFERTIAPIPGLNEEGALVEMKSFWEGSQPRYLPYIEWHF